MLWMPASALSKERMKITELTKQSNILFWESLRLIQIFPNQNPVKQIQNINWQSDTRMKISGQLESDIFVNSDCALLNISHFKINIFESNFEWSLDGSFDERFPQSNTSNWERDRESVELLNQFWFLLNWNQTHNGSVYHCQQ